MLASFRNPQTPLSFRCYDLLNKEAYVDVTIIAEGRFLQAHKLVLAAASSYFEEIFTIIPDKHPAIVLKDISYKHLQLMLQYAYCGNVDVESDDIEGFEKVLDSLKIEYDIEGPDDGGDDSDDEFSSNTEVTPNIAEITEHGVYSEMDIEEPKWSEITVKQEPKDEDNYKSMLTATTSSVIHPPATLQKQIPPSQRLIKITSQPNNYKRVMVTQRPSLPLNKSSPPDIEPVLSRPISMQQFRRIINSQPPQQSPVIRFQSNPGGKLEGKIHLGRVVPSKVLQNFMNEHPGICPFCKKQFKTPKHRNEHVKYCFQNPNRIVSVCPLCDKNVCDPYYLRKHMKNVHGNEVASNSSRDSS